MIQSEDERDEMRDEIARLHKMLDICSVTHEHNVKLKGELDEAKESIDLWKQQAEENAKDYSHWFRAANDQSKLLEQTKQELDDARIKAENLICKLNEIENLSKHAWEQVDRNPEEAKELFKIIHAKSR